MKVHYTGKLEKLDATSEKKLASRFARLGKLLDRKSEKEAHVILKVQRHLTHAEITVNFYDHPLAGEHSAPDQVAALTGALDKLEKQLLRLHDKRIGNKRHAGKPSTVVTAAEQPVDGAALPSINRVRVNRKPMTVDEAVLEVNEKRSFVAYRDAQTDRIAVLIRRSDGNFDLIES
jgi:putative sigma-54 modulation protein